MMTPFESAVRSSLEGSHGGRVVVRDDHRATALHHYRGLNSSRVEDVLTAMTTPVGCPARGGDLLCQDRDAGGNTWYGSGILRLGRSAGW